LHLALHLNRYRMAQDGAVVTLKSSAAVMGWCPGPGVLCYPAERWI